VAVLGVAAAVLVGAVVLRPRLIHVPSRSMEPVLPGERFQIVGGVVHVNGRRLDEPYVAPENRDDKNHGPFQVPVGQYYVMGDNRRDAADSRYLGAIERDRIWGKWVRW
jgi:signal peptidase I